MIARAQARFLPVTPRKVRQLARLLKGMSALQAQAVLRGLPKGAARPVAKLLDSAIANATREGAWTVEQLVISKIVANEGPMMKRYRAAAMGRATLIRKRMCHLEIELDVRGGRKNGA
jgi:large subunit ribosomal protein L22